MDDINRLLEITKCISDYKLSRIKLVDDRIHKLMDIKFYVIISMLFIIIFIMNYFFYKKLNRQIEKIEKQIENKNKIH